MPLETSSVRVVTLRLVRRMSGAPCSVVCGEGQHRLRDFSEKRHRQLEEGASAFPSGLGLYPPAAVVTRGPGGRGAQSRAPPLSDTPLCAPGQEGSFLAPLLPLALGMPCQPPGPSRASLLQPQGRSVAPERGSGQPGAGLGRGGGAGRDHGAVSRLVQGRQQVPARRSPARPARGDHESVVLWSPKQMRKPRTAATAAPRT